MQSHIVNWLEQILQANTKGLQLLKGAFPILVKSSLGLMDRFDLLSAVGPC
jgi:hypothetical protein